jgi:hypothetical protein
MSDLLARGDPKQIAAFEAAVTRAEQAKKGQSCTNAPDASKTAAHEPPMNTKTATAPNADQPPLVVNHQKCDRCGNPLCLHGPYYMLCLCDAAASPAGGGGTSGTSSSGLPTPQTVGDADASRVETPTPAGEGRVPEWVNVGLKAEGRIVRGHCGGPDSSGWCVELWPHPQHFASSAEEAASFLVERVNSGLASLRADRDRWRDRTVQAEEDRDHEAHHRRELESAQARQMTTIETLTARHNGDEVLVAMLEDELAAAKAQPARKYPTEEQVIRWREEWATAVNYTFHRWLIDRAREQEGKG